MTTEGIFMKMHQGFFVVQRVNWFDGTQFPHSRGRNPSIFSTHEDIIKRYRGIEGTAWPEEFDDGRIDLRYGLVSLSERHSVKDYFDRLLKNDRHSVFDCIVCCKLTGAFQAASPPASAQFLGFDYGSLVSETNNYSVIFNEVIYGRYPSLTSFGERLNSQCLLPSPELVVSLQDARVRLLADGADLERDEECYPIAIYTADLV